MKDKPILITGAGGGIGSALVDHLLDKGYTRIACQYRNNSMELRQFYEMRGLDFEKTCFQADLTNEVDVVNLADKVKVALGGNLWGLINLAGASSNAMSWKMSLEQFQSIVNANLTTTFLTCKQFIPEMREAGGGRIINTSSVVASTGVAGASHYCAAKAAIEGYTRAIALELANKNITANTLGLGYFDRGLINHLSPELQEGVKAKTPLKRFGHVSEIAGLVEFLLSDAGAFTTGQVLHVNGGYHL